LTTSPINFAQTSSDTVSKLATQPLVAVSQAAAAARLAAGRAAVMAAQLGGGDDRAAQAEAEAAAADAKEAADRAQAIEEDLRGQQQPTAHPGVD